MATKHVYVCVSIQYITSSLKNIFIKHFIKQPKNISIDAI